MLVFIASTLFAEDKPTPATASNAYSRLVEILPPKAEKPTRFMYRQKCTGATALQERVNGMAKSIVANATQKEKEGKKVSKVFFLDSQRVTIEVLIGKDQRPSNLTLWNTMLLNPGIHPDIKIAYNLLLGDESVSGAFIDTEGKVTRTPGRKDWWAALLYRCIEECDK